MLTSPHVESDTRGSDHAEDNEFHDRSKRARLSSLPLERGYQGKSLMLIVPISHVLNHIHRFGAIYQP